MIDFRSELNKQIVTFIKATIGSNIPVYNLDTLETTPTETERVEFRIGGFSSTGNIYSGYKESETTLELHSVSEYRCSMIIRVIAKADKANEYTQRLAGGIQTVEYFEQIVRDMYVKNETMNIQYIPVSQDGLTYVLAQINVACYVSVPFSVNTTWFDHLGEIEINIKEE